MSTEQQAVEVPEVPKDVVEQTPVAPAEEVAAPVAEDKPAEGAEATKEEVKPVEEGHLGYKAQGLSFPKNLIASKEFVSFGNEPVEPKTLAGYRKTEKSHETAHSNIAWASHIGKGLLFIGDKKSPSGLINLSDASEPQVEGTNKFFFSAKGNKHSFKAVNAAERDNWVSQLKLKIAEAKELALSVTESETYKNTLESFKAAVTHKKEEKPVEAVPEEAAAAEETPKEAEVPKEEPKVEPKAEEPKRRSASRKRASIFGFGGKKVESKPDEAPVVPAAVAADETEAAKPDETPATEVAAPVEETAPVEAAKDKAAKRNSRVFGNVFSKKEKKVAEDKPEEPVEAVKDEAAPAETTATEEAAPVIPPVETTTPLTADISSPANVPVESTTLAAANGDAKKDIKEKRKSSLGFNFGKRDKSPASPVTTDSEEKPASKGAFSKFRATINRKPKPEDKAVEEAKEEAKEATSADVPTEAATDAPVAAAEPEVDNKPEAVATSTPAVTAAA